MKKYLSIFLSSVLSGFCITFGATVYLLCLANGKSNPDLMKVIGSFMFGIGLFSIIHYGLWLYTGKVGYVLDNKPIYFISLLVCFLGNAVGCLTLASLIGLTGQGEALKAAATPIVEAKLNSTWYSIFIMSMMCGVMIYLAVDGHKKCQYTLGKVIFAFMPISLFILAGFEHVVANVAYFTYAGIFSWKAFGYFIIMLIGNGVGSILFDGLIKSVEYFKKEKKEESSKAE
ncbi:MAG: formate/nitrite transporter family protein [Acholeplasmatales bacterium]|nr:formate/nitrite transporter family protein [Acholeplasmatales bacterium]